MLILVLLLLISLVHGLNINLAPNERLVYMDDEYIEIDILESPEDSNLTHINPPRHLYEQITSNISKSNKCKKCIDEGLRFCAGNNYMDGICCNMTYDATCPPGRTDYQM